MRARTAVAAVVLSVLLCGAGYILRRAYVSVTAHTGRMAQDDWFYRPPPALESRFVASESDTSRGGRATMAPVADTQMSRAVGELRTKRLLAVTRHVALELTGGDSGVPDEHRLYYLVRSGDHPTLLSCDGYVWLRCGTLSHSDNVHMRRLPVVVSVRNRLRDCFMTFSVAE